MPEAIAWRILKFRITEVSLDTLAGSKNGCPRRAEFTRRVGRVSSGALPAHRRLDIAQSRVLRELATDELGEIRTAGGERGRSVQPLGRGVRCEIFDQREQVVRGREKPSGPVCERGGSAPRAAGRVVHHEPRADPPAARNVGTPPATPDSTAAYQATIHTNRGSLLDLAQ